MQSMAYMKFVNDLEGWVFPSNNSQENTTSLDIISSTQKQNQQTADCLTDFSLHEYARKLFGDGSANTKKMGREKRVNVALSNGNSNNVREGGMQLEMDLMEGSSILASTLQAPSTIDFSPALFGFP